jgi:GNAT superfamily N-acetyltransferase
VIGLEATALQAGQVPQASEVMGRAFFDDPLIGHFMPDGVRRSRLITWFMGMSVIYGQRYGRVATTAGEVMGAAVWLPPGETLITPWRLLQVGALKALWRLGPAHLGRMMAAVNHFEALCQAAMTEPFWYLMTLGVDPDRQGQGIGGRLLAPVLAEADATGRPCYLETTQEKNLPFYERHGFTVVTTGFVPDHGPPYWTMRRG